MRRATAPKRREPTIALINIVFLMLVFFMVAGTLATPPDRDLELVRTAALDQSAPPPAALVVHPDGRLSYRGETMASAEAYLARRAAEGSLAEGAEDALPEIRLLPDRDLPAERLVALARDLRAAGAGRVLIVTERALQ